MSEMKKFQGWIQPAGFPSLPSDWKSEWETVQSADGAVQIFVANLHATPWESPKAILMVHGMGEHGGRYLHLPHYLKNSVNAIYAIDHRGHGRSEGIRGHAERFDDFADDVRMMVKRIDATLTQRFGKSEIHLVGHSLGGLIALRSVLIGEALPIRSLTVSAPLLGVKVPLGLPKRVAAQVLSRIWGKVQMASEVDPRILSHDPNVAEAYTADRLVHSKGTPKFYTEMLKAIHQTLPCDSGIDVPFLMILPGKDQIVDSVAAHQFFDRLKSPKKVLKEYPEFFHESFNEIGKEQVFSDLAAFLSEASNG